MGLDLLIRQGDVVDVGQRSILPGADVGIRAGRIAEIGSDVDPHRADHVIEAAGKLVTPGLIDLHTHAFPGGGYYGLDPATVAWRSGVTTWVDAGSAGAYTLGALRELMEARPVRYRALLNISAIGLAGESYESRVLENCAVEPAIACAESNMDILAGIKARIDANTVGPNGIEPLRRARQVSDATGLPLMVHIGAGPPTLADIQPLLRSGDVLTHCATAVADGVLDASGAASELVHDLYERGVVFDVGHGVGGFSFPVMEAMLTAGLPPHTISSDLHAVSVRRVAFDLPTVLTKFLALGMDVVDVIAAATSTPATWLSSTAGDLSSPGTLDVGAAADIAIFDRQPGPVVVSDAYGQTRTAPERLVNTHTILGGLELTAPSDEHRESAIPTLDDLATPGTYPAPNTPTRQTA